MLFFLLEENDCEHSHSLSWEEKKTLVVTAHPFTSVLSYMYSVLQATQGLATFLGGWTIA